jgi:hypothetical protein
MIWYWLGLTTGNLIWFAIPPHDWRTLAVSCLWQGSTLIGWWIIGKWRPANAHALPDERSEDRQKRVVGLLG